MGTSHCNKLSGMKKETNLKELPMPCSKSWWWHSMSNNMNHVHQQNIYQRKLKRKKKWICIEFHISVCKVTLNIFISFTWEWRRVEKRRKVEDNEQRNVAIVKTIKLSNMWWDLPSQGRRWLNEKHCTTKGGNSGHFHKFITDSLFTP